MSSSPVWTFALLIGLAPVIAGCQFGEGESKFPAGEGTRWILTDLPGSPEKVPVPPPEAPAAVPEFRFDPGEKRVTGSTGVNRFSGPYELSGGSLRFGRLATTRRAGLPELMRLEDAYLQALTSTRAHRSEGQTLEQRLLSSRNATLRTHASGSS